MKALYPMSLAGTWIVATALLCEATMVHKDPEFEPGAGLLEECLPYR
ncbi:MAG: hypothetical protein V4772_23600 [Pseudomonadota bacterium]